MSHIRAVFFDVDDTLVDFDAAARLGFVESIGEGVPYESWLQLSAEHYPRYTRGETDFQTMRDERMSAFLTELGRPADRAADLETTRMSAMERAYALFPDALRTVVEMRRRGMLLGLITNNEGQHQRHMLGLTELEILFDEIVISGEVGVAKPDPAIFQLACRRLGVEAAAAVHVGDRLGDDAVAATAAGLWGVWLARPELQPPANARRDAAAAGVPMISSLDELGPLLDG